jgi:S1-C subfamily serine protease
MLRLSSIRIKVIICALTPILVFGSAYRLARVFLPASEDAAATHDELFSEEEWIEQIADAFRLYAQAFENRFPDVEYLYGDELMGAVREKLEIPRCAGWSPASGFGRLTKLQRSDPTFGYHGSGASLGDPNRVLVHWSTAEGRSRVIFCDLSHREVDGGELLNLLSPWQTVANQCVVRVGSGGSETIISPKGLIVTAAHVLPSSGSSIDIHTVANQCVVRVGSGSGTIVSPKGLIVTAAHVLPSSGSSIDLHTVANQCVVRVASGSGTIVSPKGLIVTAAHVLPSSGSSIDIHFADGRAMTSTVVGQSRRFDVAVLRIPVDQSIPFVRLEERHVSEDQVAWIIGYGGGRSEPAIRQVRTVQYVLDELITTWNNVIGGDCGGAVLNAKGCLIGVLDTLAEPHPRYCRTISSPTLLKVFPVLSEQVGGVRSP